MGIDVMSIDVDISIRDLNKKHKFWDVVKKLSWVEEVEEGDKHFEIQSPHESMSQRPL